MGEVVAISLIVGCGITGLYLAWFGLRAMFRWVWNPKQPGRHEA